MLSGGRCVFGFGRGAASVEYAGFRDAHGGGAPALRGGRQDRRQGADPGRRSTGTASSSRSRRRRSGRGPISHPERRFYASSVSPESAEIMAKLGFGLLVIMQNEWPKAAEDIRRYRDITASVGHTPRPPIISTNVSVRREPRGGPRARRAVPGAQVGLDRHALPLLGRPPGHGEGLRVLRRHGQDLLEDEGRELPQEGHGVLREDPGRGHAGRLHPADRRAAAADRPRPPRRPSSATAACRTRRPSSTCGCSPTA